MWHKYSCSICPRVLLELYEFLIHGFLKILIKIHVFYSEEFIMFIYLWFICFSWLPGLYFGCFWYLNVSSLVPYLHVFACYKIWFEWFFQFFFVFFNKILFRPVYKKTLSCIFLFTVMAWRFYYCYCTSVAEGLRHIKISILLSKWTTVI